MKMNLFIISILILLSCNFGIDGPHVIEVPDAYKIIGDSFLVKYAQCESFGLKFYTEYGIEYGVSACYNKNRGKGSYILKSSLDYCINIIYAQPCPIEGEDWNWWSIGILSRCDFTTYYWLNSKNPLEGRILMFKEEIRGPGPSCL